MIPSLKEHTIQLIYSLPFNVTKDTRLAIFQYKIIHHILYTNSTLFRDSIKEHDKCHHCGERQMLTHLFVTCSEAQHFWSLFTNWWSSKNGDRITLDKNEIIYGVTDNFARHLGLNLCIIIAKYYLYTTSRKEEEFYFDAFLAMLTNKIKIEKHKSKSQINMWESLLL